MAFPAYLLQEVPKPQDFSQFFGVLGAIVFLGAFAVFCYFKYGLGGSTDKSRKNGNGSAKKSGDLDPAEWEKRIQAVCALAIRSELELAIATIKATVERIETEQDRQGENQTNSIGKLAEAVNKLALAIAKARGVTGDD